MIEDHWNDQAKKWAHIGAPLRPCQEDIQIIEDFLRTNVSGEDLHALILGVTPELALLSWPENTRLLGIDRNQVMVSSVWPHIKLSENASAICGDWLYTNLAKGSMDIIVGDGCFTLLSYCEHYEKLLQEMQRILKPDGWFIVRHFCRPEQKENPAAVFADLLNGRIGNFHVFKWRLAMALHGTIEEGVVVGEIWDNWCRQKIDIDSLAIKLGWQTESIDTINNYKNAEARYTFPTIKEISEISDQYFDPLACHYMSYELGDRCPLFILKPKSTL